MDTTTNATERCRPCNGHGFTADYADDGWGDYYEQPCWDCGSTGEVAA